VDKLNPDDTRPPYRQVADALRSQIESGALKPGDKLPPHRAVVTDFGVSLGTVKRAYAALQADGLIVSRQGQGSFVRPRRAADESAEADQPVDVREELARLAERVDAIEQRLSIR
jgi:DNA-binding GntR family transcriptional regulator